MLGKLIRNVFARQATRTVYVADALRSYMAGDHDAAALLGEQQLTTEPDDVDALCVLALCHEARGERAMSRDLWTKIRQLEPANSEAVCALGEPARATGLTRCPGEAAEAFDRRLRVACEMVCFWAQHDRFWRHRVAREPRIAVPVWDGGPVAGKRILLHSMRGFGDTINFARFAAELAKRGATVRLECARPLHRLLARCSGIAEVVETGAPDAARKCDLHAPLVVLLKHFFFASLASSQGAYLTAHGDSVRAWEEKFSGASRLRVGLCWAGDPANKNDARRSVALATLAPLLNVRDVFWVSLQKGLASRQVAQFAGCDIHDWTGQLGDFADTAGLITQLDLVISVNTAVAHLAGALGRPVWILYSGDEDRRWEVVGDPRHLYPQARLFRQSVRGDWRDPLAAASGALNGEIEKHSRAAS